MSKVKEVYPGQSKGVKIYKVRGAKLIGHYQNGNYYVSIYSNGTKIRQLPDDCDEFIPAFAENMDVKITNKCTGTNCQFCHEGSGPDGENGDILNEKFIESLHPYQEIAVGGGNALEHPELIPFLEKLRSLKVIPNLTVNQIHFEKNQGLIHYLVDNQLIYGLGVSLVQPTDEFIALVQQYPNAVIHTINGLITETELNKLANNNLKILVLGYKHLRRGESYWNNYHERIQTQQDWLKAHLDDYLPSASNTKFNVLSFDNLAIEQLDLKNHMTEEEWNQFYMGDDAMFTYYIDMVEHKFAMNSTAPFNMRHDLLDSVDDMFQIVRQDKNQQV